MSSDTETLGKGSIGAAINHPPHLFHTAIEESVEAVVITDAQGKIEYVNRAFTRVTGYSREEALGQNLRILKSGEHDAEFYQQLWNTILNGESWHGELINRRKDGSFYNEEMTIAPVRTQGGEVTHFIANKKDVTSRRQLEQQLRWAESVEAIGRLAGGVVHELNNLLAIISGYGQLLQHRERPEGLGAVEEILKAGERAAALTHQLLAFSRDKGLAAEVLNLNSVVADMEKMLRLLVGEGIELAIVQQADLGLVKADQGQMEGVILNLAVNSRDAMPQGGKITIATANVCLGESYSRTHAGATPGPHVMLSVGYTRAATDDERQEHFFEPLPTTATTGEEAGLDLATVFGVIKQAGGHIWVRNAPGRGKAFKLYLPRVEDAAPDLSQSQGIPQ